MNITSPTQTEDRSTILDVLRGFALFGVLFANSAGFSLYLFIGQAQQKSMVTYMWDTLIAYTHYIFIDGKFYSLFSLLFGIGFSILLLKGEKKAGSAILLFYRRLLILMIIGALHMLFLWEGDILLLYACIGCMLPLFRNFSDRTLLITAVALILSPLLFDLAKVLSDGQLNMSNSFREKGMQLDVVYGIKDNEGHFLANGNYHQLLDWLKSGFYWRVEHILNSNRIPKVLALFIIGFVVGRKMLYARLEENKNLFKKIQQWGLGIGLPASIAFTYFTFDDYNLPSPLGLTDTLSYAFSVIPLSLAYASTICLLWLKVRWKEKLLMLAPVGRMALTNYLMQTIICSFIYYGFGLGLGGKLGPTVYIWIVLFIYVLQIFYSHLWLNYFNYGPAEWIWRQLTYGKRFPNTKNRYDSVKV